MRLAPAYDVLTTLPYGDRRLALKVQGRDDNVKRAHLVDLGRQLDVSPVIITRMLDEVCDEAAPFIGRVEEVGFPPRKTSALAAVMHQRRDDLGAR
jgi:serine/threonine-protein kinase HipA